MQLTYVTPTPEELDDYDTYISHLKQFLPKSLIGLPTPDDGNLTLVFLGHHPVLMWHVEWFKRTAEIHGVADISLKESLSSSFFNKIIFEIGKRLLEGIFLEEDKQMAIAKIPHDSKGGLGFVRRWGFESMNKTDKGRHVYKLTRTKFMERYLSYVIR